MQKHIFQELTSFYMIWILNRNIGSAEAVVQSCFVKKRDLQKLEKIYMKTSVLESLLSQRPVISLKKDSDTSVFL